jgi:hypothetical protein
VVRLWLLLFPNYREIPLQPRQPDLLSAKEALSLLQCRHSPSATARNNQRSGGHNCLNSLPIQACVNTGFCTTLNGRFGSSGTASDFCSNRVPFESPQIHRIYSIRNFVILPSLSRKNYELRNYWFRHHNSCIHFIYNFTTCFGSLWPSSGKLCPLSLLRCWLSLHWPAFTSGEIIHATCKCQYRCTELYAKY